MAIIEIKLPLMGEGVLEATIIKWHVKPGDTVKADDVLCDIATDKVDSEITAPEEGIVEKIFFNENDVVPVGKTILTLKNAKSEENIIFTTQKEETSFHTTAYTTEHKQQYATTLNIENKAYLSPLVKKIMQENNIDYEEIKHIKGSGYDGRITKEDILNYIAQKPSQQEKAKITFKEEKSMETLSTPQISIDTNNTTIIEMDRIRKIIAEHMIRSKQTSAHVTSFVEADFTHLVQWREKNKQLFENKYGFKITYLPILVDVIVKALLEYPMLNASVQGNNIIIHNNINIGIATALPNNNLIVPVIKNAQELNVLGIAKSINDLSSRARENKLLPDEITNGTFSITNLGTFETLAGTPIINQPQVAILGLGTIRKVPAVVETPYGDAIAIRHKAILSLSYDHRIIDGMLAGKFLSYIVKHIENYIPDIF